MENNLIEWPFQNYDDSAAWRDKPYEERMRMIAWFATLDLNFILKD